MRLALIAVYFVWMGHGHAARWHAAKPPTPQYLTLEAAADSLRARRPDLVVVPGRPATLMAWEGDDCPRTWMIVVMNRGRSFGTSTARVSACDGRVLEVVSNIPRDPR